MFRYSQAEDRLELCLEPHGHFPVEPNVEARAKDSSLSGAGDLDSFSSFSGAVGRHKSKHAAFTGQGHSLAPARSDIRMPKDILPHQQPHARNAHTLCSPHTHQVVNTVEIVFFRKCQNIWHFCEAMPSYGKYLKKYLYYFYFKTLFTVINYGNSNIVKHILCIYNCSCMRNNEWVYKGTYYIACVFLRQPLAEHCHVTRNCQTIFTGNEHFH